MLSATVSTAIGGFIPIIPFFFTIGMPAVIASFVVSTLAHFVVGASKALVTTRSWWASGTEMTIVGVIEAAITYSLGLAFAGLWSRLGRKDSACPLDVTLSLKQGDGLQP
jgi:VIT1/CCC1 family predicted Fe2+/Mn2+ transporter